MVVSLKFRSSERKEWREERKLRGEERGREEERRGEERRGERTNLMMY